MTDTTEGGFPVGGFRKVEPLTGEEHHALCARLAVAAFDLIEAQTVVYVAENLHQRLGAGFQGETRTWIGGLEVRVDRNLSDNQVYLRREVRA